MKVVVNLDAKTSDTFNLVIEQNLLVVRDVSR